MRAFLQSLVRSSAWDSGRRLKYLLDREPDPSACAVSGIPPESTERALRLFCDAFDIPEEQMFCLRPPDVIQDIYRAMVPGVCDDMEYERLMIGLEEVIGRELAEGECMRIATIEDLIRFVHERALPLKENI